MDDHEPQSAKQTTATKTNMIQPVVHKFPISRDLLERSELPFGVVLTPNRTVDETPQSLSGIPKCTYCGAPHSSKHSSYTIHNVLLCYLCGRTSSVSQTSQHQGSLFQLPLRLVSASSSPQTPEYTIDASYCPPLWLVVLDGSCQERSYWNQMSQTLQSLCKSAPSHVHIGLFVGLANREGTLLLGAFDLHSAVPHMQHYCDDEPNLQEYIVPIHWPHVQTAVRSLWDYYPPVRVGGRLPVASCTSWIVNQLNTIQCAGQRDTTTNDNDNGDSKKPTLCYAGAKLTFFLTQRPHGIPASSGTTQIAESWGGQVHVEVPGQRFAVNGSRTNGSSTKPINSKLPDEYAELGRQCADAAVGVDLICLPQHDYVDFGLCHFAYLSHKSGSPPPVILRNDNSLETHVLARVPWNSQCVFGAELRLRLSPGYTVEPFDDPYSEGGLFGPASQVGDHQLWRMGSACADASYSIDLNVNNSIQDRYPVEGLGQVALKPVIQICFAYTKVVQDKETGDYKTVRQMRIACCPVPLARNLEELYDSLDPEVLAVVLYHKVALASLQDDIVSASQMAQQWLGVLLGAVYRSAEEQFEIQREQDSSGVDNDQRERFVARERLLELEGELSSEDVLLGQGHEQIRPTALMVYLLLQCDPLRMSKVSMDARYASLLQMASMPPSSLTRCIAPRLQLWGKQDCILDVVDLRSEAVQSAMLECRGGTILFLDTPHEIVVMDARHIISSTKAQPGEAKMCLALQSAVKDAAESYGVAPRLVYELDQSRSSGEQTMLRLVDCLIEDSPNAALNFESFGDFKSRVAITIQAYVSCLKTSISCSSC